eukprot:3435022-Pyramimonas_sp.AAC.1
MSCRRLLLLTLLLSLPRPHLRRPRQRALPDVLSSASAYPGVPGPPLGHRGEGGVSWGPLGPRGLEPSGGP